MSESLTNLYCLTSDPPLHDLSKPYKAGESAGTCAHQQSDSFLRAAAKNRLQFQKLVESGLSPFPTIAGLFIASETSGEV
jgi:hypothetical protein